MVEMFIVGQLAAKVQAKYLIAAGAAIVAASMYVLTNVYSGLDFWYFVRARMLLSVGLPLITLPVMSLRNFARVFKRETGTTPAHFLERIRLEAAVKRLEETGLALETIARECGFQSAEHFRLAFVRCFGISPAQYRDRFRPGTGQ